jgi:hypothetical protein
VKIMTGMLGHDRRRGPDRHLTLLVKHDLQTGQA